ncbi:hypothetical protein [Roseomonas marmotae]|uniref:Uncharacterized protein n=1 Tax=Roseomonas marmotae TaxID=2768161 RepID=A0ABS3KM27_9PROT|nr:hypothetical protein [Roseomonas marmotae]MBO1077361.1 hypothetical protein [Roseomonas marmotae]QTI79870.1 hypothetical protein IAI58_03480 [Roseomonas marmotae]
MSPLPPYPQASLSSFASLIARAGVEAVRSPGTLVGASGRDQVFYIPFEHVERRAKLVLVGITPGPEQLKLAYGKAQMLLRVGRPHDEVLRLVKPHGAFGGQMRPGLLKMLGHFGFASLMGVKDELEFWEGSPHLLHSTSVVPHAAFTGEDMFNGSFEDVMRSAALRECFEQHFLPELALLPQEAVFIALGPTPLDALDYAAARGLLAPERILGALAHPSKSGGSQVDVYLGLRDPSTLQPRDPVRHRVPRLLAAAERMRISVARLRGEVVTPAAPPSPVPVVIPAPMRSASTPRLDPAPTPRPIATSGGANNRLHAFVKRGKNKGMKLVPHIYEDGCYVVSPTRYEEDYIRVPADQPLERYLQQGLRLRMSARVHGHSLIMPESIYGRDG